MQTKDSIKIFSHNKTKTLVSVIILVYNSPILTLQTLLTLKNTKNIKFETVVLDNNSGFMTQCLLKILYKLRFIDTLIKSNTNTYFAGGNNIASKYCNNDSKYYLLLNSDIKIINPNWLEYLINSHEKGITSIGVCDIDKIIARCDGYCFLIDRDLYDKYNLDENYKWWYGITKLQTIILNEPGYHVQGCIDDSSLIKHYWGGSGNAYKKVLKVLPENEVEKWFNNTINRFKLIKIKASKPAQL